LVTTAAVEEEEHDADIDWSDNGLDPEEQAV
jgi:hypothetical protein